ncbi:11570_t:CDS:2, partial [Funneliformis caledonium]
VHEMKVNETSTSSPINILPTETPMSRLLIKPFDERYSTQSIIDEDDVLEEPIDDDDVLEGQTFTFLPRDFGDDFDNSEDSDSNSSTENDERD